MKQILLFLFIFCQAQLFGQLMINEYSASNLDQFIDEHAKFEDWIEIYNASSEAIDISGYFLSDKIDNVDKYPIPEGTVIAGNDVMRFWCSGRAEGKHTSFKLTQTEGEDYVVISDPDKNILDSHPLALTLEGHSRARLEDGSDEWRICSTPTPNNPNNGEFFTRYAETPSVDVTAGFFTDEVVVTITNPEPEGTLRYTLDGLLPTEESEEYTGPITINSTTVIKAMSFVDDPEVAVGKMVFGTYFINEDFSLPVVSVAGNQVQTLANGNNTLRPTASVEYFNVDKLRTATSYGKMNKHGQDSWVNDHRSLDVVCRDEMGYSKAIKERLFSYSDRDEHQRLMLRASGDDNYPATDMQQHEGSCHVRDEYVHTLALEGGMKLDVRAVERIIVFIDGIYWGVYGLRERPVDHDYTKYFYDQDKFNLQYLATWGNTWAEYGGEQAFEDWGELRDFIMNNDMGIAENYEYVKDNLQTLSLIDYMIANLNSVASDWLNYNTGWWRGIDPDGDHKKWGYILWDNDATFDYYINYSGVPNTDPDAVPCDIDDISEFMDEFFNGWWGDGDVGLHEKIFLKLQEENDEFRQLYYSRQADLMNTVYTCENMLGTLDRMIGVIAPEMPRQIERWGGSMEEWESNVARLRGFIEERCTLLDDGMVDCFDVEGPYEITLLMEPEGVGEIDINTLDIEEFPWTGSYFGNMDNLIEANGKDTDLEFLHWESKSGNEIFPSKFSKSAIIHVNQPDTLIAVFGTPSDVQNLKNSIPGKVYPSPANDFVNVDYSLVTGSHVNFSLNDLSGRNIAQFRSVSGFKAAGDHTESIHLEPYGLTPGMYTLELQSDSKSSNFKLVIVE